MRKVAQAMSRDNRVSRALSSLASSGAATNKQQFTGELARQSLVPSREEEEALLSFYES